MLGKLWIGIGALFCAFGLEQAHAEDLLQIYALALKNDPTLSSATHGNFAAQEKLEQGKALYRPTVNLTGSATHSETDIQYTGSGNVYRNNGRESFDGWGYGLSINQPIYRKQNAVQYEQAKAQVSQADLQLAAAQQDLMLRTAQGYLDVLMAQDTIDLLNKQKEAIVQQLAFAKASFDAGVATITDVYEARAKHDSVEAQLIAATNQLQIKQRALQSIIKQPTPTLSRVSQTLPPEPPKPERLEDWQVVAEQNNLALNIQMRNLEIASKEVDKQSAGHLPTLDAVANYADNRANGGVNGFGNNLQNASIGFQFQLPLYQGGAISSRVREAVENKLKAQDDVEEARRKALLDTSQAYLDTMSSISQIAAYEQSVLSGQSQVEATTMGYQVGLRNTVDILNAQQQLFTFQRDLLGSRYSYLVNRLKLKAAIGTLGFDDLERLNQTLEK